MLKHASEVIAAENERKGKLFGKRVTFANAGEKSSAQVSSIEKASETMTVRKEKLNPFSKIEELRTEMAESNDRVKAELNEIKKLVLSQKNREPANPDDQQRKPRKPIKCPQCVQDDKLRCHHCWECGKDNHRRHDCPEKNE